jgi:hypothetical protein
MPGSRGRKPMSPLGRRKQFSLTVSPEEASWLSDQFGSPVSGLRSLLRRAMAGGETLPAEPPQPEPLQSPSGKRGGKALTPFGPQSWCERCRRLGVPSCEACRKLTGQS